MPEHIALQVRPIIKNRLNADFRQVISDRAYIRRNAENAGNGQKYLFMYSSYTEAPEHWTPYGNSRPNHDTDGRPPEHINHTELIGNQPDSWAGRRLQIMTS